MLGILQITKPLGVDIMNFINYIKYREKLRELGYKLSDYEKVTFFIYVYS